MTKISKQKGMTLVEALVAVAILGVALVPAMQLSSAAIRLARSIENNLIAANLAQEGLEIVHAMRDTNWFLSQEFDTGLDIGTWQVAWDSPSLAANTDSFLRVDAAGMYNYSAGTPTIFKRTLVIGKDPAISPNREFWVYSTVTWTERGQAKNVPLKAHFFDWK